MIHVLRERNRKLYVMSVEADESLPIVRREWHSTGIDVDDLPPEMEIVRRLEGTFLRHHSQHPENEFVMSSLEMLRTAHDRRIWPKEIPDEPIIVKIDDTGVSFSDQFEIQPPRGYRKTDLDWHQGAWFDKETGEIVGHVDIADYARG